MVSLDIALGHIFVITLLLPPSFFLLQLSYHKNIVTFYGVFGETDCIWVSQPYKFSILAIKDVLAKDEGMQLV